MMNKRGRPKKEITRDIIYKVRLNPGEYQMLFQASEWTKYTKSEVLRKALLSYYRAVEFERGK